MSSPADLHPNLRTDRISQKWLVPLALLVLCGLSFAISANQLGFFWDDWPTIWFLHFFGSESFRESFAIDRPLLAWVFQLTTPLMGESTLGWQLFGVFTRWLNSLALWWVLRLLWPRRTHLAAWAALLFAVYPSFHQQYISVTYSNGLLVYTLFLVSIATMLLAFRRPAWFWPSIALSLGTSALSLFMAEYFFGLELLRPILLWMVQDDTKHNRRERLRRVLLTWAPYLLVIGSFLVWRLFLHQTPRGNLVILDQFRSRPFETLFGLISSILGDIFEVVISAWINTLTVYRLVDFGIGKILLYITLWIIVAGSMLMFLLRLQPEPDSIAMRPTRAWASGAIPLGLAALFLSGWPIWVTDLHVALRFPWDRFTLPMMLGASILIAGLVDLFSKTRLQSAVPLALALSMAAGLHFYNALNYRQEWLAQVNLFWQMNWRAPAIEPGTAVISSDLPFRYFSDNSLTAPLNWTYAPELASIEMPYIFYDLEARLGTFLFSLEPDTPIKQPYRVASFNGSTSQVLIIYYEPPGCLKILDPNLDKGYPFLPKNIRDAIHLSNPSWIITQPDRYAQPPSHILGDEPEPGWCFFFEKAELASQLGDWEIVAALGDQAIQPGLDLSKEMAVELAPYIRGYAYTGSWDKAMQLTLQSFQAAEKTKDMLCSIWQGLLTSTPSTMEREKAIQEVTNNLMCGLP